jgi:arylsulfatase A-like enzyme
MGAKENLRARLRTSAILLFASCSVAIASLVASPGEASACQTRAEQRLVRKALRKTLRCATRRLRREGEDCAPPLAPVCAGNALTQMLTLLGDLPSQPAATRDQALCQKDAYRAAMKFFFRRTSERSRDERRQRTSARALRLKKCDVPIAGTGDGTYPRLGGACSRLMDDPSGILSNDGVTACLRAEIEKIVTAMLGKDPVVPNVLLIVTDDQRADSIGDMPEVLSRIAAQGVRFENTFTMTPICAPSRAGILTGQTPRHNGVTANQRSDGQGGVTDGALSLDEASTLATWFQGHGYRTALHGKYLNGYDWLLPHIPAGWDDWRVFEADPNNFFDYTLNENGVPVSYGSLAGDYSTDVLAEHSLQFIDDSKDQPFFLMFTPFAPHGPSTPAPRHDDAFAFAPPWRPPSWGNTDLGKPGWVLFFGASTEKLLAHDDAVRDQRETLLAVDEAVAALLDRLDRLGLLDNTIVVFTSDHGLMWGEHRWVGKQVPYEEVVRIPLAIRYPIGLPSDVSVEETALNIDLAPTLVELSDIDAPGHSFDGRTLTDAIQGAGDWRTDFLIEHFEGGFIFPPWQALRTTQFKYVRQQDGFEELYDLALDPYEVSSRAADPSYATILGELATRLDEILAQP